MLRRLIIATGQRMGPNLILTIHPLVIVLTVLAIAFFGVPRLALIAEAAWYFLTGIRNRWMLLALLQSPGKSNVLSKRCKSKGPEIQALRPNQWVKIDREASGDVSCYRMRL